MIINHTRFSETCWRKILNKYHRRFASGHSMSRTDGVAYHAGTAVALATKDWSAGLAAARLAFDKEITAANLMPAELYQAEDNWEVTELMYRLYEKHYAEEDIQIIQPECKFDVPLTDHKHNCIWLHWMERSTGKEFWSVPDPESILAGEVMSPHGKPDPECKCWGPHRVVGTIDTIFLWKGAMWINDHKTTSSNPDQFWGQWGLNYQPSIYIYGAQKALGIRPKGFVINAIFKPSEAQVSAWNARRKSGAAQTPKDYLKFERQGFLRSDEDIERARRDFVSKCEEWEWRILTGNFPLSPPPQQVCRMYNKDCEFKPLCMDHDSPDTLTSYPIRNEYDYVEKEFYQIAPAPTRQA